MYIYIYIYIHTPKQRPRPPAEARPWAESIAPGGLRRTILSQPPRIGLFTLHVSRGHVAV